MTSHGRNERRAQAEARQAEYDKLTLTQKIRRAIDREGVHTREYLRLVAERESA